jgi:3-hydroxyacyl-[acyl-carrier-protein] dehydratase
MRFLLVDRIIELERGRYARGIKNVTMSEDFLAEHFPERPIMPGILIAESLVQLADWVVRESTDFEQAGLAVTFERLKFRQFVQPGDQLQLEVDFIGHGSDRRQVKGKAVCEGQLVAAADFTLSVQPLEALLPRDEAARQYRLLRRTSGWD